MHRRSYYPHNQHIVSTITATESTGALVASRPVTPAIQDHRSDYAIIRSNGNGEYETPPLPEQPMSEKEHFWLRHSVRLYVLSFSCPGFYFSSSFSINLTCCYKYCISYLSLQVIIQVWGFEESFFVFPNSLWIELTVTHLPFFLKKKLQIIFGCNTTQSESSREVPVSNISESRPWRDWIRRVRKLDELWDWERD